MGAASLAQCHHGVHRENGRVVAVKIQHPDVRKNAYTDMNTMDVSLNHTKCTPYALPSELRTT